VYDKHTNEMREIKLKRAEKRELTEMRETHARCVRLGRDQ